MPTLNVALLDQTLAHVEKLAAQQSEWWAAYMDRKATDKDKPADTWNQGTWARKNERQDEDGEYYTCGTTACFAGWAVELSGKDALAMEIDMNDPRDMPVREEAMELLGLTDEEAFALFEGTNGLDDLRMIVAAIKRTARA